MIDFWDHILRIMQIVIMNLLMAGILERPRFRFSVTVVLMILPNLFFDVLFQLVLHNVLLRFLICLVWELFFLHVLFFDHWTKIIFSVTAKNILMIVLDPFVICIAGWLNISTDFLIPGKADTMMVAGRVIYCVLFASVSGLFLAFYHRKKIDVTPQIAFLYLLIPISQMVLILGLVYISADAVWAGLKNILVPFPIIGLFLSVVSNFGLVRLIQEISQKVEMQQKLSALQSLQALDMEYYKLIQYYSKEISLIRHDFKDQLSTAYAAMSSESDSDQLVAKSLLQELEQSLNRITAPSVCSNRTINTIVAVKLEQARQAGIEIELSLQVPEMLPIANSDLCSIYSNLLNNAIEACMRITDPQIERKILFKSAVRSGCLIVKVSNPLPDEVRQQGGKFLTTKKDKAQHGLGLVLLDSISKRYHGMFEASASNGVFFAKMVLELETKEASEEAPTVFAR